MHEPISYLISEVIKVLEFESTDDLLLRVIGECESYEVAHGEYMSTPVGSAINRLWLKRKLQLKDPDTYSKTLGCNSVSEARESFKQSPKQSIEKCLWEYRLNELQVEESRNKASECLDLSEAEAELGRSFGSATQAVWENRYAELRYG